MGSWSDHYGFPMFILVFAGTSYLLVGDHGWPMATFILAMETAILVLGIKLAEARDEIRQLTHRLERVP